MIWDCVSCIDSQCLFESLADLLNSSKRNDCPERNVCTEIANAVQHDPHGSGRGFDRRGHGLSVEVVTVRGVSLLTARPRSSLSVRFMAGPWGQ